MRTAQTSSLPKRINLTDLSQRFAANKAADGWCQILDAVIGPRKIKSPEEQRVLRIQCGFSLLGFIFGFSYAAFYAVLNFWYAVATILICTFLIAATIPMIRAGKAFPWTGNWLTGILVFGFTALMIGEGGVTAHAAAWLAGAPLCGLMMISSRAAWYWAGVSLLILTTMFVAELSGVHFPPLYDAQWHTLVAGLGFLGLGPFLFAITLTFEVTRSRAVAAKEAALEELASVNDRLKRVNDDKDHFLGIAAHDLRNPLGLIDAYAQMLMMRDELPEDAKQQLNSVYKSSQRMAGILDDLLNLNAIEQGHYPLKMEELDLGSIAEDCVERNRISAEAKGTVVEVQLESPANLAKIDDRALGQVLDNLLSNAVKYSPKESKVMVVSRKENGHALLEVIDQGPGFTQEDRKRLFQRFAKLSARPTAGESSTGLGLSIVKRITEAMHGEVECLPGRVCGTRFQLRFPAAGAQSPTAAAKRVRG